MNPPKIQPVIISQHRLGEIRNRSQSVGERKQSSSREIEEQYRNYIRQESQKMTQNWPNSVQQIRRQQEMERTRKDQQRTEDEQKSIEEMRNRQRKAQREKIQEIEESIRRTQPGPKLLDSAKLHSECIHMQQIQREEKAARDHLNRQQIMEEGRRTRHQNHQWNLSHQQRQQENHMRAMHYRQDLLAMAEEQRMRRELEQRSDPMPYYPSKAYVETVRKEQERKQIQQRMIATDAMRLAEQRRLRDKIMDKVQEKVSEVEREAKEAQDNLRNELKIKLSMEQKKRQEMGRAIVAGILKEDERNAQERDRVVLANATEYYQGQLNVKMAGDAERRRRMKAQRIQFHLDEIKAEEERKKQEKVHAKDAISNRLTNERLTTEFALQQRAIKAAEAKDLRLNLNSQCELKMATERADKRDLQSFTNRHCDFSETHKDFVHFAKEAVTGAKEKRLPLQPFARAISAYEKDNFVEEKPLLPHLQVKTPAVYYDRPELPEDNSNARIRYNIDQLRALNPIMEGQLD